MNGELQQSKAELRGVSWKSVFIDDAITNETERRKSLGTFGFISRLGNTQHPGQHIAASRKTLPR